MKLSSNLTNRSWDIQTGPLGIISMRGAGGFGDLVDRHIVERRKDNIANNDEHMYLSGYLRDTFLISHDCPRFSTGEGKAVINETIRGYDIYIIADIGHLGFDDDFKAADFLLEQVGVAAVPGSSFYHHPELGRRMLRFTFSKSDETIAAAAERLKALDSKLAALSRS